jgi:hypothetical protein
VRKKVNQTLQQYAVKISYEDGDQKFILFQDNARAVGLFRRLVRDGQHVSVVALQRRPVGAWETVDSHDFDAASSMA